MKTCKVCGITFCGTLCPECNQKAKNSVYACEICGSLKAYHCVIATVDKTYCTSCKNAELAKSRKEAEDCKKLAKVKIAEIKELLKGDHR